MRTDLKTFNNDTFIYPKLHGIYSAREFEYYHNKRRNYAVSSYFKDGEEGTILVSDKCTLTSSATNSVLHPVSVLYNNKNYLFWSEFNGNWKIKSNFYSDIPTIDGNFFVYSAMADDNNIFIACEQMNGYMQSNIIIMCFNGTSWIVYPHINSPGIFCKRPVLAIHNEHLAVAWDGYNTGYNIYLKTLVNGTWSEEIKLTESSSWDLKPSIAYDTKGLLWVAWLKTSDVERNGVISKTNHVYMASYDGISITPIYGYDSEEIVRLDLGLLPARRYFGYHGLRRNPQVACFTDGKIGLFWESQRDETEVWDNVENGWFLCKVFDGSWSNTKIIQDGGNCFTIDSSSLIDDVIHYAYRGTRKPLTDIKLASISTASLGDFKLPLYSEWDNWKPLEKIPNKKTPGIYWGDLHCHSIYSPDAEGYPDELFFYARDIAKIDFCAITDNDIYGDNVLTISALRYIEALCNIVSKDDIFQAYVGYEWTFHKTGLDEPDNFNHRTIIYLDDNIKIASRADNSGAKQQAFKATLEDTDTMWHAHHGIWDILDQNHDWNTEIVSAWTNNIERFNTVHEQLDLGHKFGFMGASDNHRFIPGFGGALTGVICKNLTKNELKESFKKRHNYASCGSRTQLYFAINDAQMGDISDAGGNTNLSMSLRIYSERTIEFIEIINCGKSILKLTVNNKEFEQTLPLTQSSNSKYIYVKIKLKGTDIDLEHNLSIAEGNYIYSSPIWII